MEVSRILAEIDSQIEKLQRARALLAGTGTVTRRGPGRPKSVIASLTAPKKKARRNLSPEARKRIADAQKRRWAEHNKKKKA